MPTPAQYAVIRGLAQRVLELTQQVTNLEAGGHTAAVARVSSDLAQAQIELMQAAETAGVPLAEATTTVGLETTALTATTGGTLPAAGGGVALTTRALQVFNALGQALTRQILTGTAATVVGGLTMFGLAAAATYILAWLIGGMAADKAILFGPAMSGLHPARGPNAWAPAPKGQHDKYYIYAVNTSGWSLYVGRPSDVEGRPAGTLTDGGTGDTPVEYKKLVETAFDNSGAALAYIKAHISPGHESRWTGTWVKFEGAEYRTVHLGL